MSKRNVNRRRWNNEKSLSIQQEVHEYNQLARAERVRQENKRSLAREGKYQLHAFPVGTHTRSVYHYG